MKLFKNKKKIIIFIIICFLIISSFVASIFFIGNTASPSMVEIANIRMINDTTFEVELSLNSSGKAIKNVSATQIYTGGSVYLKVNEVLVSSFYNSGHYKKSFGFDQSVLGTDKIKAIYLIGNNVKDIKLIWKSK